MRFIILKIIKYKAKPKVSPKITWLIECTPNITLLRLINKIKITVIVYNIMDGIIPNSKKSIAILHNPKKQVVEEKEWPDGLP